MKPPSNAKIHEIANAIFWFDEKGIFCIVGKSTGPTTLEQAQQGISTFKSIHPGEKYCFLVDNENSTPHSKEVMEYFAEELTEITKAMAVISTSPIKILLVNMMIHITKQKYPIKLFSKEEEARDWLTQYL